MERTRVQLKIEEEKIPHRRKQTSLGVDGLRFMERKKKDKSEREKK